jgi:hypothetical protein
MAYNLTIRKNTERNWIIAPDTETSTVKPGEQVVWALNGNAGTMAYLQFCDDIFEGSEALDEHWVSVLENGQSLELKVASKALPDPRVDRRSYPYAVMVIEDGTPHYAFGNNPPPDLDIAK